ncbi:MAG: hypothetical protein K2X50_09025 [Gammaproteobacteria bacterium]|nr:hypothetical protein [Gammaproteobacteria bacterium]
MKNRFLLTLIFTVTMLGSAPIAYADAGMTGGTLKSLCESENGKLICIGYVSGVTDTFVLMSDLKKSNSGKPIICAPASGISNDQAMRIVLGYITSNSATLLQSARVVIISALIKAYPC